MAAGTLDAGGAPAAGRAALRRGDWGAARAAFAAAGDDPAALEGLSWAAWWEGDEDATLAAREQAYRGHLRAGDRRAAARMAMWLGSDHLDFRGDDAPAAAWLRRARALVADGPPCAEQAWGEVFAAEHALLVGSDPLGAERHAARALAVAREVQDAGAQAVALAMLGSALIGSGAVAEGVRRLEECAAMAVGEEFEEAFAPGWALCRIATACADLGDLARAEQWCRALHDFATAWHGRSFFGACRVAYGGVLAARGDFPGAEAELVSAREDLCAVRPGLAAPTAVRLGELRLRQGDHAAARALLEGALPMPAATLALGTLDLATGDPLAARDAAERVLRRLGDASVLDAFPALELLARACAAAGDHVAAAGAAARAQAAADRLATPYMAGRAHRMRAEVALAAGAHEDARRAGEDAVDRFGACAAPYDAAQARLVLAAALAALGREDHARREDAAARATLARLGAGRATGGAPAELTAREVEILRLVARGRSDAQIAERLFLSPHTVHRHVANIRAKLRAPSRAAAVASATALGVL